jgi:hypothetical protein
MGPSSQQESVLALGRRIRNELGIEAGRDTLADWMAQYLAELLQSIDEESDPEKRANKKEHCCRIIQQLWEKRQSLPGAASPLGRISEVLKAFLKFQEDARVFGTQARECSDNPWCEFAKASHSADRRMSTIAVLACLIEQEIAAEKTWLMEHGDMLDSETSKLIEALDRWVNDNPVPFLDGNDNSISSLPATEREEELVGAIEKSVEAQRKALDRLKSALEERRPSRATGDPD